MNEKTMDNIAKELAAQIEADLFATICGPVRKQRQTALRVTSWGSFETVELDDAGNVIEPPKPCPRCRILLCPEHMAMVT